MQRLVHVPCVGVWCFKEACGGSGFACKMRHECCLADLRPKERLESSCVYTCTMTVVSRSFSTRQSNLEGLRDLNLAECVPQFPSFPVLHEIKLPCPDKPRTKGFESSF